jgi:acyl-homoserine-lactone acylase
VWKHYTPGTPPVAGPKIDILDRQHTVSLTLLLIGFCSVSPLAGGSPEKGTEILWDRYGVAHVYAKSTPDLFYGYGWAQAKSHGDLLLHLYGESRGRAAEYFGPSSLENDEWVWTNSVPQRSARWLAEQTPEFRSYLEAFAKGINDYAAQHPGELSPESRRVLPVNALDPIEHTHRIVHFTYMGSQRLAAPSSAATVASLFEQPESIGSNGWAIAPSHTAHGKSLLLGNPHLPWGGWQTYYEIQLTAPGIDLYGASQVGFPVLRFVFSHDLGFNQTVNSIDTVDLYRISTQDDGYVVDGKVLKFETESHDLKVRQNDGTFQTKTLHIRRTVHGPIIKTEDGSPIAMKVAALDRPFMLEQYWQMETARDFVGFQKAIARLQVPCFNIIYADKNGHIEYLYNGTLPRRKKGDLKFWAGIVPGDTSETLWTEYLSYAELPKSIDPPSGFVQNTNDPPWNASWPDTLDPSKYPPYVSPKAISFRAERSIRMLTEDRKLTFERFIEYKHSTRAEMADRILPDLIEAAARYGTDLARQAAAVLSKWDRLSEANSRGGVLFYAWATRFMGPTLASQDGFGVPYDLASPLTTPRGLKDPKAAAQQLDAAAQETLKVFGALDVPWGDVMRFQHAGLDLPANGGFGNLGVFRVITFGPLHGKTRSQVHGETYIAAVEFSNPVRARVLMTYGNSSQPGSPHQGDQLPLLARKELRTAWLTKKEVKQNLESQDVF